MWLYITTYNVLCFYLKVFRPVVKCASHGGEGVRQLLGLLPCGHLHRGRICPSGVGAKHDEAECQKMFGQNANPLDIFRHSNKTFYLILVDNLVVFSSLYVFFSCSSCSQSLLSILFCFNNVQSAKSPASPARLEVSSRWGLRLLQMLQDVARCWN